VPLVPYVANSLPILIRFGRLLRLRTF